MYSHLKLTFFVKKNRRNCFWSAICCSVSLSRQAGFAPAGEVLHEGKGKIDIIEWKKQNILL